ncbi:MAG: RluA family pseudouridine synthase [Candidatus Eremiobacteraeota bacterium]|nr:RluA family pseudouridine synthase [Candidatus Eremiobacteraeota bacterium]
MSTVTIEISPDDYGKRIDIVLAGHLAISRNQVQRLIERGGVLLSGDFPEVSDRLKKSDTIVVELLPPERSQVLPENIPLAILYEDEWVAVVNKPRGMAAHPGAGRYSGTLVNALLYAIKDLSGIGGVERPGIVHRLDRDTSGVMVIAKNDGAHAHLSLQFAERQVKKEYLALVHGEVREAERDIVAPIGRHPVKRKKMAVSREGRFAHTRWEVVERFRGYSLLKVRTLTGRTHQIRVHLTSTGFPLVGDEIYGVRENPWHFRGHALHAARLEFMHPRSGQAMEFEAPLCGELQELLFKLRRDLFQA